MAPFVTLDTTYVSDLYSKRLISDFFVSFAVASEKTKN